MRMWSQLGGQILLSAEDLKKYGAKVKDVLCVIEREEAGRTNLENADLEFRSLFRMDELLSSVNEV